MAKVQLIDYTGHGRPDQEIHAAHMLIFTKSTRLSMNPDLFKEIQAMDSFNIASQLKYMASTIASSWEFIDCTFLVSDVSRACAQQMTRTRNASYAMQSQRVADLDGVDVLNPCRAGTIERAQFYKSSNDAVQSYIDLTEMGATREEARGLLPMNTRCNLVAKYNLRSLVELVTARKSMRTQSEYGEIVLDFENEVLKAWPWASVFFKPKNEMALQILEEVVEEIGLETGTGLGWKVAKAMDLIRQ